LPSLSIARVLAQLLLVCLLVDLILWQLIDLLGFRCIGLLWDGRD
jgi:hypothetical protein